MQFDVRHNIADVARWLDDAQRKQVPFASVHAMTLTAKDVKTEEQHIMRRVFDRPTPYAINALRVQGATKATMTASVEFRGSGSVAAKRFLNPNVRGGQRSRKSNELKLASVLTSSYVVPAKGATLDKYGNMKGGHFKRILSQLKVSSDPYQNATNSRRSKAKRKAVAIFVSPDKSMIMERRKKTVKPLLIAIRAPVYKKRFPFYETAEQVVARRMPINFEIAFQRAMATSGFKSPRQSVDWLNQSYAKWRASAEKAELFGP